MSASEIEEKKLPNGWGIKEIAGKRYYAHDAAGLAVLKKEEMQALERNGGLPSRAIDSGEEIEQIVPPLGWTLVKPKGEEDSGDPYFMHEKSGAIAFSIAAASLVNRIYGTDGELLEAEPPKTPSGPGFLGQLKQALAKLSEWWQDAPHKFASYNNDEDDINQERTNSQKRVALLIMLSLLLGAGLTSPLVFYVGPTLIAAVGVSLGISTLGVSLLALGIGGLLVTAIMAAAENLDRGRDSQGDYFHKQRQTYLRRVIFATLMLAGIGIGIFLAGAFPLVLGVFASVAGPGIIALALAGAAGLVAMGLLTSLIYAAVVIQYELTAEEYDVENSLLEIINRHPLLFRVLLGALIAAGIGALMVLVFPGALAAFAVAVGLTVGSPLALMAGVGTVMLLSAAFGMSLLGFLEMRLKDAERSLAAKAAFIIIPAAIAGAALGIFLGVTALPVLTFGLSGPAALAVAGAIGLAASIVLVAAALGGIRSYQIRKTIKEIDMEEIDIELSSKILPKEEFRKRLQALEAKVLKVEESAKLGSINSDDVTLEDFVPPPLSKEEEEKFYALTDPKEKEADEGKEKKDGHKKTRTETDPSNKRGGSVVPRGLPKPSTGNRPKKAARTTHDKEPTHPDEHRFRHPIHTPIEQPQNVCETVEAKDNPNWKRYQFKKDARIRLHGVTYQRKKDEFLFENTQTLQVVANPPQGIVFQGGSTPLPLREV